MLVDVFILMVLRLFVIVDIIFITICKSINSQSQECLVLGIDAHISLCEEFPCVIKYCPA